MNSNREVRGCRDGSRIKWCFAVYVTLHSAANIKSVACLVGVLCGNMACGQQEVVDSRRAGNEGAVLLDSARTYALNVANLGFAKSKASKEVYLPVEAFAATYGVDRDPATGNRLEAALTAFAVEMAFTDNFVQVPREQMPADKKTVIFEKKLFVRVPFHTSQDFQPVRFLRSDFDHCEWTRINHPVVATNADVVVRLGDDVVIVRNHVFRVDPHDGRVFQLAIELPRPGLETPRIVAADYSFELATIPPGFIGLTGTRGAIVIVYHVSVDGDDRFFWCGTGLNSRNWVTKEVSPMSPFKKDVDAYVLGRSKFE